VQHAVNKGAATTMASGARAMADFLCIVLASLAHQPKWLTISFPCSQEQVTVQ
jgi:hypothetical protein